MSDAETTPACPLRVFDTTVRSVRDLTPHFRRITFAGPALDRFGVPGPTLDLRVRLLLPVAGHSPSRPGAPDGQLFEGWYQDWVRGELPARGCMRSYTVRALRASAHGRELDIDFVIHPAETGGRGAPASDWARAAAPGTAAVLIGPDAHAITPATPPQETGIRWDPQGARRVLLAGDETAVPAISSILEALPADTTGEAFLEVPDSSDFQDICTGSGVGITWLARNPGGMPRGDLLHQAVVRAVPGITANSSADGQPGVPGHRTPSAAAGPEPESGPGAMYAWVAGEAGTVRKLRRHLVDQLGVDPKRSELRAYWSLGKAGSGSNGVPIRQDRAPRPMGPASAQACP